MPPANKSDTTGNLRRGLACLSCRRRKLKCDGLRPVCQQCTKMKRPDECQYDDSKRKSRTQMLREKLSALEERVRELESESGSSNYEGSPSSLNSPQVSNEETGDDRDPGSSIAHSRRASAVTASSSGSPLLYYNDESEVPGWGKGTSSSEPSMSIRPSPFLPVAPLPPYSRGRSLDNIQSSLISSGDTSEPVSYEMHAFLIQTFTAHQKQCCFYADLSRFNKFPLLGPEPPVDSLPGLPHPALTNAVYLLGCHFARSPLCSDLQPGFMKQTLHEIVQSLRNPEPLIDVIQASCLLGQYFYFNGRAIEGYRHSFAATRMSVGLGLHQIRPPDLQSEFVDGSMSHDWGTIADRITVFWQIFVVDRLWSAANGLITALPDEKSSCRRITTPLPTTGSFMQDGANSPASALFDLQSDHVHFSNLTIPALKAMAACLFDRTSRVHSSTTKDGATWANHRSADAALSRIIHLLPPFQGVEAWRTEAPFIDMDIYVVHMMIYVSTIHLQPIESMNLKLEWAANGIVGLVTLLHEGDYPFLDPIVAVCWGGVVKSFIKILKGNTIMNNSTTGSSLYTTGYIHQCVDLLSSALRTLSVYIPLAVELLRTIDAERMEFIPLGQPYGMSPPLQFVSQPLQLVSWNDLNTVTPA